MDPIVLLVATVVIAILVLVFGSHITAIGSSGAPTGSRVLGALGLLLILLVVIFLLRGFGVF